MQRINLYTRKRLSGEEGSSLLVVKFSEKEQWQKSKNNAVLLSCPKVNLYAVFTCKKKF